MELVEFRGKLQLWLERRQVMTVEDRLKDAVLEMGADFVGIAPRSRFAAAPQFSDPSRLLPKYCSVVAFGIAKLGWYRLSKSIRLADQSLVWTKTFPLDRTSSMRCGLSTISTSEKRSSMS